MKTQKASMLDHETESFAGKLLHIRHCKGFSRKQRAVLLSVSEDAVRRWEKGAQIANEIYQKRIHSVWNELSYHQKNTPYRGVFLPRSKSTHLKHYPE